MRYLVFQQRSNAEELTSDDVAKSFGYESPAQLYHDLSIEDGFPVCLLCGTYAPTSNFCDGCEEAKHSHRRRATDEGEPDELPPVANAADLFSPVVQKLAHAVRQLDHHVERYHARRFEQADVVEVSAAPFSRGDFSSEEE